MMWTYEQTEQFLQRISEKLYKEIKDACEYFFLTSDKDYIIAILEKNFDYEVDVDAIIACF